MDGLVNSVLNRVMTVLSSQNTPSFTTNPPTANFAGNLGSSHVFTAVQSPYIHWIIDTGASDHMTSNLSILYDIVFLPTPILVGIPDGTVKHVYRIGKVRLTPKIELDHVLYIPDFKHNLLSVGKLVHTSHCIVIFNTRECVFEDLLTKTKLATGQKDGDLYWIRQSYQPSILSDFASANNKSNHIHSSCEIQTDNVVNFLENKSNKLCPVSLLHARLGHTSIDKLRHVDDCNKHGLNDFFCKTCVLSKHHTLSFNRGIYHAKSLFELVHVDIWGPYKHKTLKGAQYFLTIVDDYLMGTWTCLFSTKCQVLELIRRFLVYVDTHFERKIKFIRSDHGSEFIQKACEALFHEKGIVHQKSVVDRPQQNGRVERKYRHLIETSRALRIHANLPIKFWGDCLLAATYLINKMPTLILKWDTPFELIFNDKPSYDELRVIGCLCYANMSITHKDKFRVKARNVYFLDILLAKKDTNYMISTLTQL